MKKKIESYQGAAGGWGAVKSVANAVRKQMDIRQDVIAMFDMNKPEGFDCPGCAWPDPKHSASFDICENGAKAIAWEVTDKQVNASFFAENTVQSLLTWGDHELEAAGRLTQPLKYDDVSDCYKPLSWQQAFDEIGARLQSYSDPNQVEFYTSGRTSNEAAFLYQLFAREYGSNNFPDCSNMCHEPTSVGLAASIGVGKGTVLLEDFEKCDLVICIGHNPGTNHPRMLTSLRALVKRGAKMIAINPLQERGLERFTAPQNPFEMLTNSETQLASAYYNVRIGGDMALLKGMMRLLIERDDAASAAGRPSLLDDEFIQTFTVGGTEWSIQGYMVYTVVLIVIGGTLFTHKVGKRIRPLNVEKQRSEATFRTNLVQHNKQAELIALSNAESLQRQELSENFHTIKENWHRLMNRQRWLDYWQNIYSRSLSVLPYFLLLPQFISGQINLGGLMKSRQAFMLVSNNLSWFIYKYDELAELAAVIDRLYEFHQLTEQRPTNKPKNCQHAVQVADASIRTPDNKIILENLNFHVSPGKWLLLKGYSGAGKTTLLKTLSHCWPWFKGDISSPADSWYVSQTPLIKTGLLKEIICKALPLSVDDKSLSEVLHQVGLGKLAARIHDHDRWGDILSSGEKQRIALARLILRRPKWIFLDETTSHLEEQEAIRLLRLVREKLPTSGVIMVTHQPGVWNLVDDICDISAVI